MTPVAIRDRTIPCMAVSEKGSKKTETRSFQLRDVGSDWQFGIRLGLVFGVGRALMAALKIVLHFPRVAASLMFQYGLLHSCILGGSRCHRHN